MYVTAKQRFGIVIVAQQRGAGQTNLDRIGIRLIQVGQKTSFGVVTPVHFVEEIHPLNIQLIIIVLNHIRVVLKLLDIHHRDFGFSGMVVQHQGGLDVPGKGFARINLVHHQSAGFKFPSGLYQQIQPVHDEVKLRNHAL